jgi:hypothetical protein
VGRVAALLDRNGTVVDGFSWFGSQWAEIGPFGITRLGPDGAIYTGTFFGISKYSPDIVSSAQQSTRAHAGVDQALDLLTRAQLAVGASATARARDFVGRAYRQISATLAPASVTGPQAAYDEIVDAAGFTFAAFGAIEASLDPSADISQAIVALTNAAALLN